MTKKKIKPRKTHLDNLNNLGASETDHTDDGTVNNLDRAEWAITCLYAFAEATGQLHEPADDIIGDLLADLMHLCRMNGLDFDKLAQRARNNHEAETQKPQQNQ